ncbi:beta-eliminating lyase-related protein [Spongiactinospora gelatinilytica]|uniref:beta-eliminating lyase-related protein n=1 Tax=Spongiactinospora gelatinilytica TaxID=2666298 RepID=UPI0027B9E1CA|nr:beta-eliminating lyase-related protein [Spongiactinospora gelatinilytica]
MTVVGRRHDPRARGFASDKQAGVHPEVLRALALANEGHQSAYGDDVYTEAMEEVFRAEFGPQAHVWPVFNGTGANVVGLRAMCAPWEAVIRAR